MIRSRFFDYEDLFLATFVALAMLIGFFASWINYDLKTLWVSLGISYLLMYLAALPIGAAFTALHYVCLKMVRDEEGYVTKDFFKSFKLNFRQATIIWAVIMLVGAILAFNFSYIQYMSNTTLFFATSVAAAIFLYMTFLYVFPVLSHFENNIKGTVRNAFFMSILALPKTVLMILVTLVPVAIIYFVERFEAMFWLMPLTYLFWFSAPAYVCAKLYDKTFKRFEPEAAKNDDFGWTVSATEEDSAEGEKPAETTEEAKEESTEQ